MPRIPFEDFQLVAHRAMHKSVANSMEGIGYLSSLQANALVEIDVTHTTDHVAVLSHDLSLDREFGISALISDLTFAEIGRLKLTQQLFSLEEVLRLFPAQPFLFDLRLYVKDDLLTCSPFTVTDFNSNIIFDAIQSLKIALSSHKNDFTIMNAALEASNTLTEHFPTTPIYTHSAYMLKETAAKFPLKKRNSRQFTRNVRNSLLHHKTIIDQSTALIIEPSLCSRDVVSEIKKMGCKVIMCPDLPPNAPLTHRLDLAKWSYDLGADGQFVSLIDQKFLEAWEDVGMTHGYDREQVSYIELCRRRQSSRNTTNLQRY